METIKTIAIINDPKVTLGSLSNSDIEEKYAWDVDWESLSEHHEYIILGGHMGAYEIETYPYLLKEKEWLNKVINNGTKVFGICLGAQLIADSMGGTAFLSEEIEFGFKELEFHKETKIFSGLKNSKVFLWHRDTFTLPPSAELIASTKYPQIFTIQNSIAVQFHPEVTETLFKDWYDSDISRKELVDYDVSSTLNYLITNTEHFKFEINSIYKKWKNI